MKPLLWNLLARIVSQPKVADWLIKRAQRTPYTHIYSPDGENLYMGRWWLFNGYDRAADGKTIPPRFASLPSIRIHHICREDRDRDLHDHPWNARTVILKGWYEEERPYQVEAEDVERLRGMGIPGIDLVAIEAREIFMRDAGYTGQLLTGQYHRISEVAPGGAWTLFITWGQQDDWGFLVNGTKVPHRTYLHERGQATTYETAGKEAGNAAS